MKNPFAALTRTLARRLFGISADEIRYSIEDVRSEIRSTRAELKAEIAGLRREVERLRGGDRPGVESPVAEA